MKLLTPIIFLIMIIIVGCGVETEKEEITKQRDMVGGVEKMKLTSPAFENNQEIPSEYTCDGADISPELNIGDVPENAKSLALIMDDPDAPGGTWVHWVVWNIPPDTKKIAKDAEPEGIQGTTSFGKQGYGGPCPPSGTHRYIFKLYALDTTLDLEEGSDKKELEAAMQGHIIEKTELTGPYKRK
jgi:Raf kinase inhibitor-like YbhB/YbcL family protein